MGEEIDYINARADKRMNYVFDFIEHRITLEDSISQILTEPKSFSFLNINKQSKLSE